VGKCHLARACGVKAIERGYHVLTHELQHRLEKVHGEPREPMDAAGFDMRRLGGVDRS